MKKNKIVVNSVTNYYDYETSIHVADKLEANRNTFCECFVNLRGWQCERGEKHRTKQSRMIGFEIHNSIS